MVDVFISYSRTDLAQVTQLARAVEAEGYQVWWDAELPPHLSYGDVITAKIAAAKAAIVVWSKESAASEWVRAEADMARNQKKLVQTALGEVMPPLPFNQIQFAEIGDWHGEPDHPGWRKVKVSLAELCGAREPVVSAPALAPVPASPVMAVAPPAARPARWPLYAGLGVAAIGVALAAGMLLGQRGNTPAQAVSQPTSPMAAEKTPTAVAAAPAVVAQAPQPRAPAAAAASAAEVPAAPAASPTIATTVDLPPAAPRGADLLFPDSSTRLLQPADVASLSERELRIARNEIFARKGMRFTTPMLQQWFGRFTWYQPRYDRVTLTPIERANIATIRQAEARLGQ